MQNQACDVKTGDILPKMAFRDWIELKENMKLSLSIPLRLTIIVVVTGIIAFIKIMTKPIRSQHPILLSGSLCPSYSSE
jgi:hypothetical protein